MKTIMNLIRYDSFTIIFDSRINKNDSKTSNSAQSSCEQQIKVSLHDSDELRIKVLSKHKVLNSWYNCQCLNLKQLETSINNINAMNS